MKEGKLNINYRLINDSNYYPNESITFYGIGGSYGYADMTLKADGNLVISSQGQSNKWTAAKNIVYLCG